MSILLTQILAHTKKPNVQSLKQIFILAMQVKKVKTCNLAS